MWIVSKKQLLRRSFEATQKTAKKGMAAATPPSPFV
jgi:hypothetical protein